MDEERCAPGLIQDPRASFCRLRRWRPRDWVMVSVPGIIVITVVYLHFTSPPPALSLTNYKRITMGMCQREVESIIRARTGGYGAFFNEGKCLSQECGVAERWSRWGTDYGILEVGYDATGRVCCKRLEYQPDVIPVQPDLWPWWRRLFDRSVPRPEPLRIYTHS